MYAESTTTEMTTYAPREPPEKSTLRDFWAKESAVNALLQTSQVNTQFLVPLSHCPIVHSEMKRCECNWKASIRIHWDAFKCITIHTSQVA